MGSESTSASESAAGTGREYLRIAVVCCCVFGVLVAAALVPALPGSSVGPDVPGLTDRPASGDDGRPATGGASGTGRGTRSGRKGSGRGGQNGQSGPGTAGSGGTGATGAGSATPNGASATDSAGGTRGTATGAGGETRSERRTTSADGGPSGEATASNGERSRSGESGQDGQSGSAGSSGSGAGGFGALNAGGRTTVGGAVGKDAFRSQSTETHFVVRSDRPAYWRTAAYGTYTGDGWEASDGTTAYGGELPPQGASAERFVQRVTLRQSATSLPAAWRPRAIAVDAPVGVTDRRAFRATDALPAGTTYEVVSHRPPRNPGVLRRAGTDYPDDVTRYTRLPASTPDRLGAFTTNLTSDADSPYEKATAIEGWLERSKTYSLNASHDGGDVATQFVFEMDRGYCEYFATAMTAMLRTQDVPARYVVGYSRGERTEADTYVVRGMNAHAWVEVYFPDVGWVTFDPTPAGPRRQSEANALDSGSESGGQSGSGTGTGSESKRGGQSEGRSASATATATATATGDTDATRDASGGSDSTPTATPTPTPGGDRSDESKSRRESTDSPTDETNRTTNASAGSYRIQLSGSPPIPGTETTVTVTSDGDPVEGATVRFEGEVIGTTNASGQVVGTVPYVAALDVTVEPPATTNRLSPLFPDAYADRTGATTTVSVATNVTVGVSGAVLPGETVGVSATIHDRPVSDATVTLDGRTVGRTDDAGRARVRLPDETGTVELAVRRGEATGTRTLTLDGDVAVAVRGETLPGARVTVTATAANASLPNATVRLNGTRVAETGVDGRATVTLSTSPGNATLAVQRAGARGSTTVHVEALSVRADPRLPVALPGGTVEIRTALDGEPVGGVPVAVGGERAGRTGPNGTATATLPFAPAATVEARAFGQTATTTVGGLYRTLALLVGAALALLGAAAVFARRRGVTLSELGRRAGRALVRAGRRAAAAVVAFARRVDAALSRLAAELRRLRERLRDGVDLRAFLRSLPARLRALPGRLAAWLRSRRETASVAGIRSSGSAPPPTGGGEAGAETVEARLTVREAWREFLGYADVGPWRSKTPGEAARRALERREFPPEAVRTLVEAYRDVEYGDRDPGAYLDGVGEAIEAVRAARGGSSEGEPGGGSD